MTSIDEYFWVRTIMKEVIGEAKDLEIRASGTTPHGPELEMGLHKSDAVERLLLRNKSYDLNERTDREQYVRDWTASAVEKLRER